MGFKANIDIALSFSNLKFCTVRQQGQIKFRVCLYYTLNNGQQKSTSEEIQFCHPYSILRKPSNALKQVSQTKTNNLDNNRINQFSLNQYMFPTQQSQLDLSTDYYLSRAFRVMFQREVHHITQTCCFRTSIDIQRYEDVDLKCQVQLLFCPNTVTQQSAVFKTIGKCQCKVRKMFDVSAYLPIVFDQFEGVVIQGIYQAALIDFKYQRDPNQKNIALNPQNFHEYLKKVTNGFNRAQVRNFYKYYRELLQKQLFSIQERHYDLVRVMGFSSSHEQFRMMRVNANSKIDTMIDHLGGYNSHQNPYFNHRKSQPQLPSSSSSNSCQQSGPQQSLYLNRGIISRPSHSVAPQPSIQSYKLQLSQQIIYDYLQIKALIYKKWSDFLQFSTNNIISITSRYRNYYNNVVKERLSGNVFSHRVAGDNWKCSVYEDSGQEHMKVAEMDRMKLEKDVELWKESFLVENQAFFTKDAKNIKIFQQIYPVNHRAVKKQQKLQIKRHTDRYPNMYTQQPTKRSLSNLDTSYQHLNNRKNSLPFNNIHVEEPIQKPQISTLSSSFANIQPDQDHFIILVHGFQASRQDFILIKNCLQIRFKIKVYISTANEGRTDDDIETQGKRLALQIQKYINDSSPSQNYRLSFLGHSMGGVIIRAALCYLQNVQHHLHSYISFSTPHLGYLYEPSTHIQAGLWLLGALQKTSSIQQICTRDNQDLRKSLLYRLSQSKSLNRFKHISLVGSHQDKYVPYESARIEYNNKIIKNNISTTNAIIIQEMIQGLLGGIQCNEVSRMDVIFSIQESNFDSMIGRTAHIRYLSDRQFIKVFCIVFEKFFK